MKKIIILLLVAVGASYFFFDVQDYLRPSFFQTLYQEHPFVTVGVYFGVYVLTTAFSLPVGALLTLVAGGVFGLVTGTVLVSFASTIGATFAFLLSRILLREWVQKKFEHYLRPINKGVAKDGGFYLFTLRLIPVFPFWVINLLMGLTPLKTRTYFWLSQLGMLPATIIYVNAGAELGAVNEFSAQGILTPSLLLSFILLAALPFFARALLALINRQRVYRPYKKPRHFDNNVVVVGAGSGGLVTALIAATVKAKVTLVEKHKMGGDCLNTGCVPSKALIRAARAKHEIDHASELGINTGRADVDFSKVMAHVRGAIETIAPHDSVERFTGLGVACVRGDARLLSPWEVRVGDKTISARNIVIATGARPHVPSIPGIEQTPYLNSANLWELNELPARLLVLGAGPIGCELAQAFQRLGSEVTLVGRQAQLLPQEDDDVGCFLAQKFEQEGVVLHLNSHITRFSNADSSQGASYRAELEQGGVVSQIHFDKLLVATGRKANTEGMGFEELGLELTNKGTLAVDDFMRTRYPNIFACGDVVGPYQFTHMAAHQAWYAAVNALFGGLKKFRIDYKIVPRVTFVAPEVARVGLNEREAREQGVNYELNRYDLDQLDRAITDRTAEGFVKVLTVPGKDKILGATIVGSHAGESITEFVTAMKQGRGLNKILSTIHAYPTLSEANKFLAGNWKRAHAPQKTLRWLEKYHHWKRG